MSLSKKIPRSMSRSRTIPYKEINITCHYRELHSPQRPNISIRKESNCPVLPHSLFQIESVNCGYGSIPILIRSSWLNSIHFDFSRVRLNWCRLTRSSSPSYSVIQNGQESQVPYHCRSPHLHGNDRLLQNNDPSSNPSPSQYA